MESAEISNRENAGRYQYKPFTDSHSFRLLCLHPPSRNGGLECALITAEFPFDEVPLSYEAISYIWGDPTDQVDVICDGKPLAITKARRDVLERVRENRRIRIVWVDGICINQHDIEERTSQVKKMGLIYLRARRVQAWLGQDEAAEKAARLLRKMVPIFERAMKSSDDLYLDETMSGSDQAD